MIPSFTEKDRARRRVIAVAGLCLLVIAVVVIVIVSRNFLFGASGDPSGGTLLPQSSIGVATIPPSGPTVTLVARPLIGIDEASITAGFAIIEPSYLPAGYYLAIRNAARLDSGTADIWSLYQHPGDGGLPGFLSLSQTNFAPEENPLAGWPSPDAARTDVVVRGVPGVWVDHSALGIQTAAAGGLQLENVNVLTWNDGTFTFILQSNLLPLSEMTLVAESLGR